MIGRAVITAVAPALVLAGRPPDEIEDAACLEQREHEQQDAGEAHAVG